jgi:glycosyltransferase involved in cell wall biosynthesis
MPQQLSAVIITYNEARNIGRCLQSLAGVADEIVVLDSFSTDETEAICRQFGVRFFQHAFDAILNRKTGRSLMPNTIRCWPWMPMKLWTSRFAMPF